MNPIDAFLSQLDTLRTYSNAKNISVLNPILADSLASLAVGNFDTTDSPITKQEADKLSSVEWQIVGSSGTKCYVSEQNIVYFHVESLSEDDDKQTSRRAPIQSYSPAQQCFLKLTFDGVTPDWIGLVENTQQIFFSQLMQSTNTQLELISHYTNLLSDPLTKLFPRPVLQNEIASLCQRFSVGLVMLHCIDFQQINRKFGHDSGDKVIQEIASALQCITRDNDILSRFGGALFAVAFPANEKTDVASLAKKLQRELQNKQYLEGAINLTFDIGAAIIEHQESYRNDTEKASALVNRADQALKLAQQESHPSIITWQKDDFNLYQQQFNYLGGIFTADTVTDYRNMLLLWDISSLIADKHDFSQLAQSLVQRLAQTFEFSCAGLLPDENEHNALPTEQQKESARLKDRKLKFSINDQDNAVPLASDDDKFLTDLVEMQGIAVESNRPSVRYIDDHVLLVLPMEIESSDCFYVCGLSEHFEVTHDTKVLLSGLTRQLGKSLRRSRLEDALNIKLATQNEQLQNELAQLKVGLQVSSIIYQSDVMHQLMKQTKRAAMTDTTVLVTGESGTGKERLINAIHQMGNRSKKPFVIVDCGSIPETLIESELFGYVKGAFTGAQNTSTGKILDAKDGVLVLDEIGELPLNMQTKLLRFVQEKHFTPVGGNKLVEVDVKIVAVTNRDLAYEVEQGNFRKDLYYRLNVLTLHNPPLRDRPDDIALLSSHFLSKFSEQFDLEKRVLSVDAAQRMRGYSWPGNIRELENRLMQATLQCDGTTIDWSLLNIDENNGVSMQADRNQPSPSAPSPLAQEKSTAETSLATSPKVEPIQLNKSQVLNALLDAIKNVLTSLNDHDQFAHAPLGLWIEEELIHKAYLSTGRKMRTTAARLCISQSTARRKVDNILQQLEEADAPRPDNWQLIVKCLEPIADGRVQINDCVARIKLLSLEAILSFSTFNMAQVAEMLGVSEPTLYKLKREMEAL